MTELSNATLVAFVATSDTARARAFYEGVLGLRVVEHDEYACVVDAHGTEVRITAVPEPSTRCSVGRSTTSTPPSTTSWGAA